MTVQDQDQSQRYNRQFRLGDSIPEAVLDKISQTIEDEEKDPALKQDYREDKDERSRKQHIHPSAGVPGNYSAKFIPRNQDNE